MLRILNCFDNLPQNIEHKVKTSIHPGKFVSLDHGKLIVSDGFNIYGVVDDVIDKERNIDTTLKSKRLTVWPGKMVFQTDMFENDFLSEFQLYKEIYVRKGRITSKKWHHLLKPVGIFLGFEHQSYITVFKF